MEFRKGTLEDLAMNPKFWNNKKVLLTGHTGFKGSWLSLWLQHLGTNLVGYALPPPTHPSLFDLAKVAKEMISIEGDVRDYSSLKKVIIDYRPEIIIHMAAQSLVGPSYLDPVETYATNLMGTVHLLEAVRQAGGVKAVINVTSDKCYENHEWIWGYRENEAMGGHDPYSSSKGCSELITSSFRKSFFNPKEFHKHGVALASVRAGNVIGGGDWAQDRLIPDIMRAWIGGKHVSIRNPDAVRPWQHVLEPLAGYLLLAEKLWEEGPKYAEAWNFGPEENDTKPVSWIADHMATMWGHGGKWDIDTGTHQHEAGYLKLDCSKAKMKLGWSPRMNISMALDWIVTWYRDYSDKNDMRKTTEAQIGEYASERYDRNAYMPVLS